MSLFLPILLLGFAQPAEQPVPPPATPPQTQTQNNAPAASSNQKDQASRSQQPGPSQQFKHLDPIEIYPSATSDVCFTMRSYYFMPQDDRALKPDGMTTCESGRDIAKRNAKKVHNPRLVPLVAPAK